MIYANDGWDMNAFIGSSVVRKTYPFSGIYSDVDINFNCGIVSIRSLKLIIRTGKGKTGRLQSLSVKVGSFLFSKFYKSFQF